MDNQHISDRAAPGQAPGGEASSVPSVQRLLVWVRQAQPGARMVYAQGQASVALCCPELLRRKVWELGGGMPNGAGYLTSHYVKGRCGEPSQHIVIRTARPIPKGVVL